jgi:hypothetical protein
MGASMLSASALTTTDRTTLAAPESFAVIADKATRSAAMFAELGKVLSHPRSSHRHGHDGKVSVGTGYGRHPPPGTQQAAGALVAVCVETGATCPK